MSTPTPRLTRRPLHLFFFLLAPLLTLCLCALTTMWIPLPFPFPPAMSGARSRMAAALTGVLGLGYLVGLTVYLVFWVRQVACVLDPVLTPMGLTSEPHMVVGRSYRGMIEGRAIEVVFMPAYAIAPTLLSVIIDADLGTRMAVGRRRPRLDCTDCAPVGSVGWGLEDLCVVAEDGESARRLLANPRFRAALMRLLADRGAGLWEIYVQPGRVWLRARPRHMAAELFRDVLDDLRKLAESGGRF